MGIIETIIKETTKKTVVKTLGKSAEKIAFKTIDAVDNYKEKKFVCVPFGSDGYELRNYKDVMDELIAYGFTNIALFPIKDLIKGWIVKDGQVEKIVINGKEKFRKNARFEPDVRVVITYHTFRNK